MFDGIKLNYYRIGDKLGKTKREGVKRITGLTKILFEKATKPVRIIQEELNRIKAEKLLQKEQKEEAYFIEIMNSIQKEYHEEARKLEAGKQETISREEYKELIKPLEERPIKEYHKLKKYAFLSPMLSIIPVFLLGAITRILPSHTSSEINELPKSKPAITYDSRLDKTLQAPKDWWDLQEQISMHQERRTAEIQQQKANALEKSLIEVDNELENLGKKFKQTETNYLLEKRWGFPKIEDIAKIPLPYAEYSPEMENTLKQLRKSLFNPELMKKYGYRKVDADIADITFRNMLPLIFYYNQYLKGQVENIPADAFSIFMVAEETRGVPDAYSYANCAGFSMMKLSTLEEEYGIKVNPEYNKLLEENLKEIAGEKPLETWKAIDGSIASSKTLVQLALKNRTTFSEEKAKQEIYDSRIHNFTGLYLSKEELRWIAKEQKTVERIAVRYNGGNTNIETLDKQGKENIHPESQNYELRISNSTRAVFSIPENRILAMKLINYARKNKELFSEYIGRKITEYISKLCTIGDRVTNEIRLEKDFGSSENYFDYWELRFSILKQRKEMLDEEFEYAMTDPSVSFNQRTAMLERYLEKAEDLLNQKQELHKKFEDYQRLYMPPVLTLISK